MKLWFASQLNNTISEDVEFLLENYFDAYSYDIWQNPILSFSKEDYQSLNKLKENNKNILLHMPFFLPTNTSIPEIFDWVKKYVIRVIKSFKNYKIHSITFHTWYVEQIIKFDPTTLIKNLNKLNEICKINWIQLNIENDDKNNDYPLRKDKIITQVLNSTNASFTYDIWHWETAKINHTDFIKIHEDRISVYHVHNNFGEDTHDSIDSGSADYSKILPIIEDYTKDDIVLILEHFPYSKILYNKNKLNDLLDKIN